MRWPRSTSTTATTRRWRLPLTSPGRPGVTTKCGRAASTRPTTSSFRPTRRRPFPPFCFQSCDAPKTLEKMPKTLEKCPRHSKNAQNIRKIPKTLEKSIVFVCESLFCTLLLMTCEKKSLNKKCCIWTILCPVSVRPHLPRDWDSQCDQMAKVFYQYWAI